MEDFLLREEDILERVDEYTLFCHYLGFKPDLYMKYTSPIPPMYRGGSDDKSPSFGIFRATKIRNREFGWKDQGGGGLSGDIFTLVKFLYGYRTKDEAVARVASDFGFGGYMPPTGKLVSAPVQQKEPTEITVMHRPFKDYDFQWWRKFNISRGILEFYRVRPVSCYWTHGSQKDPRFPEQGFGFVYKIGTRSQLYFPLAKPDFKFRNDMSERELGGFDQLTYRTRTLVITKSYKDVMCLRSFQYDSVCSRGESVMVPQEYLSYFEKKYDNIFVLFDNDGKHIGKKYPYPFRQVPLSTGEKDTTDFCKHYGPKATEELLNGLIR